MNPLTNVKNITKLNETELKMGIESKNSWHDMYSSSAWIFIGGLPYDLSEGDVITVFSQYGEVVNINLIRDRKSGKSKGFCFLCFEDQRSTVLSVDNMNGIKLLNRVIRVDHVSEYKIPKEHEDLDDMTKRLYTEGCAPQEVVINGREDNKQSLEININFKNKKKHRKRRQSSSSSSSETTSSSSERRSKRSKHKSKRKDKKVEPKKKSRDYERHSRDRRHERHRSESNKRYSEYSRH